MEKSVGRTKGVGFQFGVQRTFLVSKEKAWDFVFSSNGLKIWLGDLEKDLSMKEYFKTQEGIAGFVRVFKPYSHIRLNWKKKDWTNMSTVQIRVLAKNKDKTTISFHQEKLLDSIQRKEMKKYWYEKMEKIMEAIEKLNMNNSCLQLVILLYFVTTIS